MKFNELVYSKGRNVYFVRLSVMNNEGNGGWCQTLQVRADNWRGAKNYVEQMDPFRIWKDYGLILRECGCEPKIVKISDKNGKCFYKAPEPGNMWEGFFFRNR